MTSREGGAALVGLALLGVLLTGCSENGVPCIEVTHSKKLYPKEWPQDGSPVLVYDSSYKRCGAGVQ